MRGLAWVAYGRCRIVQVATGWTGETGERQRGSGRLSVWATSVKCGHQASGWHPVPCCFKGPLPLGQQHAPLLTLHPQPACAVAPSMHHHVLPSSFCRLLAPWWVQGSLASGTFAAYSPVTREAEVCDVQPQAVDEEESEEEDEEGCGMGADLGGGGMDVDALAA